MNVAVFARINRMTVLSAAERMVLVDLCAMPSETVVGHVAAAPAQSAWAKQLGIGDRGTLSKHIQALADAGVIRVIKNGPSSALYEVMPVVFDPSVPPHRVGRRGVDVAKRPQQDEERCGDFATTRCGDSTTTSEEEGVDVVISPQLENGRCGDFATTRCGGLTTTSADGGLDVVISPQLDVVVSPQQDAASRARAMSSSSSSSSSSCGDSTTSSPAASSSSSELALQGQRAADPATMKRIRDLGVEFDLQPPLSRWQIRRLAGWQWQGATEEDYRMAFMRLAEMGERAIVPFRYLETVMQGRLRERESRAPPGPLEEFRQWAAGEERDGADDEGRDGWPGWYGPGPGVVDMRKWREDNRK